MTLMMLVGALHAPAEALQRRRRSKPKFRALRQARAANAALGLKASTVAALDLVRGRDGSVTTIVPIDGRLCTLDLRPRSVRGRSFRVRAQRANGSFVPVKPGKCCTLRGRVSEMPGCTVAASLSPDGLRARIILPDHTSYWVEPLRSRIAGAGPNDHVIYSHQDVIPQNGTCMTAGATINQAWTAGFAEATATGNVGASSAAVGGLSFVKLAIDADSDFVGGFPDDQAAIADIESIINAVNAVYERDVSISHVITEIVLRTPATDPYVTTDPTALLCAFRAEWNSPPESLIPRDAAHLFTGKNLVGSTIGIAFVSVMCNVSGGSFECSQFGDLAYGLSQSTFSGNLDERVALTAHELGHNWGAGGGLGADHCDVDTITPFNPTKPGCYIMCSVINGCNGVNGTNLKFGPWAVNLITAFRDAASCPASEVLLDLTIRTPSNTVDETSTLQFTAEANFAVGGPTDVTSQAIWSIDPPGAGTISSAGLFTPANVNGDACAQVSATFTFDTTTLTDRRVFLIRDLDVARAIVASVPDDGTIDARQPSPPSGTPLMGWNSIDLTFNGDTCLMSASSLDIVDSNGARPAVSRFEQVAPRTVRVTLIDPVTPGVWTNFTEIDSGATVRIAALPVDADGDGVVGAADIVALEDSLNGIGPTLPRRSSDIDRSGRPTPADLLRAVDLLTGAESYDVWSGATLPP